MPAKKKPTQLPNLPPVIHERGAPAELRAIEVDARNARARRDKCLTVYESACADALNKPQEKDGTDWSHVEEVAKRQLDDAESRLIVLLKLLLPYDKSIDETRRDATEKMPREQVITFVKMHAIYSRQGVENLANRFAGTVRECRDNTDVHKLTHELFHECNLAAIDSAVREAHLPAWCKEAIESVL